MGLELLNIGGFYMKKSIILLAIIIFISCDRGFEEERYIVNNCNETIDVTIILWNDSENNFSVDSNNEFMYDKGRAAYGVSPHSKITKEYMKNIIVTKGNEISKIDYVDVNKWIIIEVSDGVYKSYLPINPEDFE
ncbi:hypothetical protein FACS189413_19810 [Bacteroidia bacterium]|nr:hypothetical protein FACS189413_19810 [Bacteroidia bacterium]